MKTIEVEDSVYSALEKRVTGFGDTPNEVIKRLILNDLPTKSVITSDVKQTHPLLTLIESPEFKGKNGKNKYFAILEQVYLANPEKFSQLEGYKRGSRINISAEKEKIEASGKTTLPQKIPNTPYYVLTNLDHKSKRDLIEAILQRLEYPQAIISAAIKSIPDSGISRLQLAQQYI